MMSAFVKFVAFAGLSVMANAMYVADCDGNGGDCANNCGNGQGLNCADVCQTLGVTYDGPYQCNAGRTNGLSVNGQPFGRNNGACAQTEVCCGCSPPDVADTCADFDGSVCAGELKLPDSTSGNTALECCVCPPCEIGCDPEFECVAAARKLLELEVSKPNLRA